MNKNKVNWRIPPRELKLIGLATLAILIILLIGILSESASALDERHYEMEIRDNETIWMWSTHWAGARVFTGCERGDGCSFKVICEEAEAESGICTIDSTNITATIKTFIDEKWKLQQSWSEGELFNLIRGAVGNSSAATKIEMEKQFNNYQEWVEMEQMPEQTEFDNAIIDKNRAVNELEVFRGHYEALNKSSRVIIEVKDKYIDDMGDLNGFLQGCLAVCMFIILYDSGVLSSLVESAQGLRSRVG